MLNRAFSLCFCSREKQGLLWEYRKRCIFMKNENLIKMVGIICTIVGCGITIIQDQLKSKEMEQLISDEVSRQLNERTQSDEF